MVITNLKQCCHIHCVQKAYIDAYIKAYSAYTFKRTTRTFYKKTSIKIVSLFFWRKNVLKLIIINGITFLHDNINKITIKKVLKLGSNRILNLPILMEVFRIFRTQNHFKYLLK
jgi:hypothetical protein